MTPFDVTIEKTNVPTPRFFIRLQVAGTIIDTMRHQTTGRNHTKINFIFHIRIIVTISKICDQFLTGRSLVLR